MATEKVKKVQELRRSNAATPIPSKKKYTRKTKHKKEKYLKTYCDLVAPFFNQLKFQLNARKGVGVIHNLRVPVENPENL